MKLRKSKLLMGIFISSLVVLTLQLQVFAEDHEKNADILRGDIVTMFQGVNPETGGLVWEGTIVGDIAGNLFVEIMPTKETGVVLHFVSRWTFESDLGDTASGQNNGKVNASSLRATELGVIETAMGEFAENVGYFVIIRGKFSDVDFIPGVTQYTGVLTVVPANRY